MVVIAFGNWISRPQRLNMGLQQGTPLSPVLYNDYTKGLADLNSNGLTKATGFSNLTTDDCFPDCKSYNRMVRYACQLHRRWHQLQYIYMLIPVDVAVLSVLGKSCCFP